MAGSPVLAVAITLALLVHPVPAETGSPACDALCARVRAELADFTGWLKRNGERGFVGEVGWPDDQRGEGGRWAGLAEAWFADADAAGLWVTAWATGEWWGTNYPLTPYEDRVPGGGLDSADVQAGVLEAHPSGPGVLRGVNVAGAEFGAPSVEPSSTFSNQSPGVPEVAYHYDSQATFDYLSGRGVRLIRLPVRWERLQRAPFAPLDDSEVARLRGALLASHASGLQVVIDVHNYGGYYLFDGTGGVRRPIGSGEVPVAAFADLWSRLSAAVSGTPGLVGYGLMNEPVGLPSVDGQTPARVWERASQVALDAVRARGDHHLVFVPAYEWAGAQRWSDQHPSGWIRDPAGRFMYEAHHYWDGDNSGRYARTYAEELEDARARGYPDQGSPEPGTPAVPPGMLPPPSAPVNPPPPEVGPPPPPSSPAIARRCKARMRTCRAVSLRQLAKAASRRRS